MRCKNRNSFRLLQGCAKGQDEQVGDDHLPTRPASTGIIVAAFLRHDGAKITLFLCFAFFVVSGGKIVTFAPVKRPALIGFLVLLACAACAPKDDNETHAYL